MQAIGGMTRENAFILGLQDCQFLFEFSILPAASLRPLTQTDRASRHSHDRASIRCAPRRPAPRPSGEHQVDEEEELVINPSTTSTSTRSIRSAPGLLTNINPSTRSSTRSIGPALGPSGRAPRPASLPHQHQSQPHSARPRRPVTPRNLRTLPARCNAHLKTRLLPNNQGGLDFSTGQ